jgi:hypothetical protein
MPSPGDEPKAASRADRLRARLRHRPQARQVIALAATGQLSMATAGQIGWSSSAVGRPWTGHALRARYRQPARLRGRNEDIHHAGRIDSGQCLTSIVQAS